MNDKRSREYLQVRREARDQRKADRRARFIETACSRPAQMAARLFPADTGLADRIRSHVAAQYDGAPHDPGASVEQMAFHEAGHVATAETLGLIATSAEIHGSPFGRYGWGGSAGALERPVVDGGRWGFTDEDAEREAIFALGGPVAEHLWAIAGPFAPEPWKRGNLYASLGEILEACTLAAHVADRRGEDRAHTLRRLFVHTAQAVLGFGEQVEQIARRLIVRHRINRTDRGVAKILLSIRQRPLDRLKPLGPDEVEMVEGIITGAPSDLVRFTAEVGR